ncbi:putative F-box protein PP2-B12 [Corylus avellana]|uniref:putative F-box protein PP2-B12 n=1 Tax=Corylus avellana TaxID=13451 RepID=UPI001E234304|nr:putative F-box protein PP2-B12 [Corylus avellana]
MALTESEVVGLINVLPIECVASVLSFTSPPDACRSSSVSTSFRSAAESDAVWESFLPPQYKSIISRSADSSSSLCFSSKKELYLHLCDHPLLIDDGRKSFWLEKMSGKICYMLSPKDLLIAWMENPHFWRWTSLPDARLPEVAELIQVWWLEIRGKINTCMLSRATLYTAYLVFNLSSKSRGFVNLPIEAAVRWHKRMVFLDVKQEGVRVFNPRAGMGSFQELRWREGDGECPKKRGDGWLEIELGDFFNGGDDDDDEVEISVLEVKAGMLKSGLIVQGIEIRPKRV